MVTYECRSLERICMEAGFRFATDVPAEEASPQSAAYVAEVLEEAEAPDYWVSMTRASNFRS